MSDKQQPAQAPQPEPKTPRDMLIMRLEQTIDGIRQMMTKIEQDSAKLTEQYNTQMKQAEQLKAQGVEELGKMEKMLDYLRKLDYSKGRKE
jgi:t-SNARE complex subunit (syntaxin)